MKKLLSMLALAVFIVSCGNGDESQKPECTKDNDCKPDNCHTAKCVLLRCEHTLIDSDGDGFFPTACGGNDCADADEMAYPGAQEVCGDMTDNNCDGKIDEGCPEPRIKEICDYYDNDNNNFIDEFLYRLDDVIYFIGQGSNPVVARGAIDYEMHKDIIYFALVENQTSSGIGLEGKIIEWDAGLNQYVSYHTLKIADVAGLKYKTVISIGSAFMVAWEDILTQKAYFAYFYYDKDKKEWNNGSDALLPSRDTILFYDEDEKNVLILQIADKAGGGFDVLYKWLLGGETANSGLLVNVPDGEYKKLGIIKVRPKDKKDFYYFVAVWWQNNGTKKEGVTFYVFDDGLSLAKESTVNGWFWDIKLAEYLDGAAFFASNGGPGGKLTVRVFKDDLSTIEKDLLLATSNGPLEFDAVFNRGTENFIVAVNQSPLPYLLMKNKDNYKANNSLYYTGGETQGEPTIFEEVYKYVIIWSEKHGDQDRIYLRTINCQSQ